MISLLKNSWVIFALRIILGIVFLYASFDKIRDPGSFSGNIQNYQMLPYGITNLFSIFLPCVELCVGASINKLVFVDGAALLSVGMLVMFIIALGQAVARGLDIECGCFSQEGSLVGLNTLLRDLIWLAMSVFV